jgi:phosphoribosylformylglycinamidine (FGAM) synthase-like enzyme
LFHESPSRILISADAENAARIQRIASEHGVEAPLIGETVADKLAVTLNGQQLFEVPVSSLFAAWDTALPKSLDPAPLGALES